MKIKYLVKKYHYIILVLIMISFVFTKSSFAKYNKAENEDFLYEAKSFYFNSDSLNDNTNISNYTLAKGTDYIEFNIFNNEDNLRYSEVDINYTVSITDINGNTVKDKNNNPLDNINDTLEKNIIDTNTHRFNNLLDGAYTIIATSNNPYRKLIKANFIVNNSNTNITYSITDAINSPILQLTLSTNDYSGNILIKWPSGITPDNTISVFNNLKTGYNASSINISVNKNSNYVYQFFKENPSNVYTASNFTIGGVA